MTERTPENGFDERTLHAYYDGELGALARWRFERRLARSAALRRDLVALETLGELVRDSEPPTPRTDLWEGIAERLPAADAERVGAAWRPRRPGLRAALLKPLGAVAAAAAVAAALAFGLFSGENPPTGVVHWVDGGNRNVMVLEGEGDVTIIWVFDPVPDRVSRGGHGVSA
jgi:anti-sigma-K factor RskA